MARPTPVLPDVGSTMVPPGLRSPSRSAASIIATAGRSFTDPPGFVVSILATRSHVSPRPMHGSRTRGVSPMSPRTESATSISPLIARDGTPHRRILGSLAGALVLDRRERAAGRGLGSVLVPRRRPAEEQDRDDRHPPSRRRRRERARPPLHVPRPALSVVGGRGPVVGVAHRGEAARVVALRRHRQATVVAGRGLPTARGPRRRPHPHPLHRALRDVQPVDAAPRARAVRAQAALARQRHAPRGNRRRYPLAPEAPRPRRGGNRRGLGVGRSGVRRLACVAGAAALVVAACGGSSGGTPPAADEVVLRVLSRGGFAAESRQRAQLPRLSVYGDGRVITLGPTTLEYPGP